MIERKDDIAEEAKRSSDSREEGRSLRPRVGFLGVGWIGRHRLEAVARSGSAEIAAVADLDRARASEARSLAAGAVAASSLEELLEIDLDGVVIATPSALHAEQALAALERGLAVFCQKPLGRSACEARQLIEAARSADRLLAVDMSYRFVRAVERVREILKGGEIGEIYGVDLVFHNAYGPDKSWYYDPLMAGGGCVIDLGIHLADLALWCLGFPRVLRVSSRLFAAGKPIESYRNEVEDYAVARLDLEGGAAATLACSWHLAAGRDAVIRASFFGTRGGLAIRNIGGSFYDFCAERYRGTSRELLAQPPDAWGGRAVLAWTERLGRSCRYHHGVESAIQISEVIDAVYGRQ